MNPDETEKKPCGRYLTHSEMEQFKMDCPVCGKTFIILEFSEHLKEDIEKIKAKAVRDL